MIQDWMAHTAYDHQAEAKALLHHTIGRVCLYGTYGEVLQHYIEADSVTSTTDISRVYDTIILAWPENPSHIPTTLKMLSQHVRTDGRFIIETADETSEYVKILESLQPGIATSIRQNRRALIDTLVSQFKVHTHSLETEYTFDTVEQAKDYFIQHATHEWNRELQESERELLDGIGTTIQEKSFITVCELQPHTNL